MLSDQFNAVGVEFINSSRAQAEAIALNLQDLALRQAINAIDSARNFIGARENILGSELTKHGEIAEHVEVCVRNARSAVNQSPMTATMEGVGRLDPADYRIDGIDIQSKFYNGSRNTLDGVLEHLGKYKDFTQEGAYYHIPKDQFDQIQRIISGQNIDDLSDRTIRSLQTKVAEIEVLTGRPFNEVVRPGVSDYAEVQQGVVNDTLDNHESDIRETNTEREARIHDDHQASFAEGLKATGMAAGIAGGMAFGAAIYAKHRGGKNVFKGDFDANDWREVGVTTTKGAFGGAVAGASIYTLTNYASMGAPFAAAVVSTGKGVASLVHQLNKGDIDADQFVDLGMAVCSEAAIVTLATMAGQAAIPVPFIGGIVGSLAGRMLAESITKASDAVRKRLEAEMIEFLEKLDDVHKQLLADINAEFDHLGGLMDAAFSLELNIGLREKSLELARTLGVPEHQLIKNDSDLDSFMML
ncbi:hypothetical protein ACT3R7_02920 [Halomonas sp. AOP43-A1-21]